MKCHNLQSYYDSVLGLQLNSGEFPNSRASRRAINEVIAHRSRSISLIVCRDTPSDSASLAVENKEQMGTVLFSSRGK